MTQQIIKLVDLKKSTRLSATTIYRLVKQGDFPKPIKLGQRSSGWLESEVRQWLTERIEASRGEEV